MTAQELAVIDPITTDDFYLTDVYADGRQWLTCPIEFCTWDEWVDPDFGTTLGGFRQMARHHLATDHASGNTGSNPAESPS